LRRHPWLTALGLLLLAIAILIAIWDWNWFKGPIEHQVQARTGRRLDIGGDLDVDLGRVTTIRAGQLRFANAAWSKQPTMASVRQLAFGIEVWPLLFHRQVRIPEIHLGHPDLLLEKAATTSATGCSANRATRRRNSAACGSTTATWSIAMRRRRPTSTSRSPARRRARGT
jgi:uncharacterized protein involved in outer membrane biogenesis